MDAATQDRRRRFEDLAMPYADALFSVARRLTGGTDEAEDVVQETFLRAYRTFDNFRPGTNAKAWLFTVLYSIAKNRFRQTSRRPTARSLAELEEREAPELEARSWGSVARILHDVDESQVSSEIVEAFAALPPEWRMIFLLVHVEGLSYEETGEIVGCSVGTVASRLSRSRKQLFAALQRFAEKRGLAEGTADG